MKINAYRFAIAMVVACPLAISTAATSFAAALTSSAVAVKAAAPAAATEVRYRKNVARQYWNYDSYYNRSYWNGVQGVVPYNSNNGYDPLRGRYFVGVPY
jgi:hypothetical protein